MTTQVNLKFTTNMDRGSVTPTGNIIVKGTPWNDLSETYDYDSQEAVEPAVNIQLVGDSKTDFLAAFLSDLDPLLQYRISFTASIEDELNIPIEAFYKYFGASTSNGEQF